MKTKKINRLRIAAVGAALGLGIGAAYAVGIGSAAASSASVSAMGHDGSSHRRDLPDPYEFLPKVPTFTAYSTTVRDGHPLPLAQWSGIFGVPGGKDVSPELSWYGFPKQTKSFVISMYDPQAPTQAGFFHWIVEDIPATTTHLPQNAGALDSTTLPAAAIQLEGDAGIDRYIGAAPPAGSGIHDYYITITALDEPTTGLGATASGALLNFEIDSHTLARASLMFPTMAPAK